MSEFFIAPIVEGHGEVEALPALLQRVILEIQPSATLRVNPPLRIKSGKFLQDADYFRRYVVLAALKAQAHPNGSVLILLDCEDDCARTLGPQLLANARDVHGSIPIIVVLAVREYESWFLAAAHSLRGVAGLPQELEAPSAPEQYRDAKGWLESRLGFPYNPPNHQPLFTRYFSFQEAINNRSFARFHGKLAQLFTSQVSR